MSRCLVTGHTGYIGAHLYKKLQLLGHEVIGIDSEDPESGSIQEVMANPDLKKKYEEFCPEYIFHLACWPRVGYSVEEPLATMRNNVIATSIILDFAKKVKCKRFIYSSSSSVVGNGDGPESPYALQKYTSEIEATLYYKLFGMDTVSLRYFNVYSPDQSASGPYATAIANWMEFIRQGKRPFITGTGEQRRDMLHVLDVVSANIFSMERDKDFCGDVLDVGTGNNISLNEIRSIVLQYFPDVEFDHHEDRPGDVMETRANTTKLDSIGWKAKIPVNSGVSECFSLLAATKNV